MASELSDSIEALRTYLPWLEEWIQSTDNRYAFVRFPQELRLLQRICDCLEMFFLEDFTSESGVAIKEKEIQIYTVIEKVVEGELEYDENLIFSLVSSFDDVMDTLRPLFQKAVDKSMNSSQSKHCSIEELVDLIDLVSEDGKEIHSGSNLKSLQLHKLYFLKDSMSFVASQDVVGQDKLQDFLAETEVVVLTAACHSYMLWIPEVMDETTRSLIYSQYSEMLNVLPLNILKVSRSSRSSNHTRKDDDDIVRGFINSLIEKLKLLDYIFPVVNILVKELRFLRNSFMYQRQKGGDQSEEFANLICDAGMLFYSLSLDYMKEDTELGLSNWMKKVQFLKEDVAKKYPETSRCKFPRCNELGLILMPPEISLKRELPDSTRKVSDSTWKLSDLINILRAYLPCLEIWTESTDRYASVPFANGLRLIQRICSCLEMFFLKEFALGSEKNKQDGSLESFLDRLRVATNEKAWEIYTVIQELWEGKLDGHKSLVSSFHQVMKILRPLFRKAVDKYMHSSQSKHCTMEELADFIQLVSEDAKEVHKGNGWNDLQLHKLEFLKNFIRFVALKGVGQDKLQDLLAHVEVVVTAAACCSDMIWNHGVVDETTRSVIRSQYFEMLQVQPHILETYIRILKASGSSCSSDNTKMDNNIVVAFIDSLLENHWDLLGSKSSFTVSIMKILIEELRFLKNVLIYRRPKGEDLDEETANLVFDMVSWAGIVSFSLSWDNLKEGFTKNIELAISNWMEKVHLLMEDVVKKYPETSRYKFPRANELGFMDGLLEDLKDLIKYNPDSIAFAQGQLDLVREDLVFLRDFLWDTVKLRDEHEELKSIWFRVVDIAYRFEFLVNSLMVGDPSPDCSLASFHNIKEKIKKIKAEVEGISKGKKFQIEPFNAAKISNHLPPRSSNPTMDEVIVGFEDEAEKIIDRLEAKSAELDVVSIVGMPGQGKTTLAKKVYNDIRSHFHVCAWCCVSQGYQKRKLLLDILNSTDKLPNEANKMSDEDLEKFLYQSLKGRRYLIVLDDIWDIEAWQGLQSSFPNDRNQSRILLTSRIHRVALQTRQGSKPHFLRPLNDAESKELLQKKLFHNKSYAAKARDLEMQIARSCKGLPLAVVTVAGILANLEQARWEDFAKGLRTGLVSGTDQCTELLELSYMHLPDYLKPCLLYFGSFLEDEGIPVSRLIRLWIAEGFVQKTNDEKKSLEKVAEDYLTDLINRSLVMVLKQTSRGGIKFCSVHDLVHQFCVTRARDENVLHLLNLEENTGPSFEPRRLCISSWKGPLYFRHLSSLKFFPGGYFNEVSSILCRFNLLKVLDLRGFTCNLFPIEVEMLVQLRFLALVGHMTSIPSTIVKLWNLESFLLRGLRGQISLPYTLLNMTKLRHLQVHNRVVFRLSEQNLEKCGESCNLETFSTPLLSSEQDMLKIIRRLPYLRKLKCIFFGSRDSKQVYQFPKLNFLSRMESLKVNSTGKVLYQLEFSFPSNLKKLTLSNFCLPWASVSRFSQLPNLEVLKLLNRACEGETWDLEEEEEFRKLRFLKLEDLSIVHWNASSDNFPCLRQLVLHDCRKLQGIPSSLGEVTTLETIEVKWCHKSLANSARILEEEIEGLKAFILSIW